MALTLEECIEHIPGIITPQMEQYAIEEVFKYRRYIFTERHGKKRYGYCTYCNSEFDATGEGLRHNYEVICPSCGSLCMVKASGLGRKTLIDEAYFTYYLKSEIDPQVITAVGMYAVREFSGDYRGVRTQYFPQALYVFQPGIGGTMFRRPAYYIPEEKLIYSYSNYTLAKSVKCQFTRDHNNSIPTYCSRESIAAAVKGTPFQYSTWEEYDVGDDMTPFFDLFSRYPCVEYLTKLGFKHLVKDKITGNKTYSAINWRGKTMQKVLRLTNQELQSCPKDQRKKLTFSVLHILQAGKKDGSNFSLDEAVKVNKVFEGYIKEVIRHRQYANFRRIWNYATKQAQKNKRYYFYHLPDAAFIAWRDYLKDCRLLELDLTKEQVLFPGNLYSAHQNTIKQVKIKADELLNKKIKARVPKLERLCFEHGGMFIRPAGSTEELIAEGKAMHHCVGTYAEKYATGETNLLFIRKIEEPDKPFYTVEIIDDQVIQCRGIENRMPTDEVKAFLEAFKAEKLAKPAKPNRNDNRRVAV